MSIPSDPGTGLLDNNNEPILLAGATGLHARYALLYAMFNGGVGPDNITLGATYLWTGAHTFNAGNLKIKGAGSGIASLQNANTSNNRTMTIPDAGADDTFLSIKYVKVSGAGVGIATVQNANTSSNRTITIPDAGADDTFLSTKYVKVAATGGFTGVATLYGPATASNLTFTIPNAGVNDTLLSTKMARIAGAGSGIATIQNATTSNDRTLTIPDPGANDTFLTQLTANIPAPNWINNLGLQYATTSTANDSIKVTSRTGSALSSTNILYATLPSDTTPGLFEQFSFTSDITLKISGAHWGIDGTGNITGAILRVGLINDGGATPALAVYYLGGRTTIANTHCSTTQTSITEPEYVLVSRAINVGSWPLQEIGYFLADFTDSTNVWAVQPLEIWPGRNADGRWQNWNAVYTGFSATQTLLTNKWTQHGGTIFLTQTVNSAGTSNAVTLEMTLPIKSNQSPTSFIFTGMDNGVQLTAAPRCEVSTEAISFYTNYGTGAWTSSGSKYAEINHVFYEAKYN